MSTVLLSFKVITVSHIAATACCCQVTTHVTKVVLWLKNFSYDFKRAFGGLNASPEICITCDDADELKGLWGVGFWLTIFKNVLL